MTVADVVNDIRHGARRSPDAENAMREGAGREDPDDALQLSLGMAFAIQLRSATPRTFEDALELAGRILCPIFDYAKPAPYRAEMRKLRLRYGGIAGDSELQRQWVEHSGRLASQGRLESIATALEGQLWLELDPQQMRAVLSDQVRA